MQPPRGDSHLVLAAAKVVGPAVRALDALLIRVYGIRSLSGTGRDCGEEGLRIRPRALPRPLALSGVALPAGSRVIEIHLCNDRAPEARTREGAARWATRLLVRYRRSCRTIAWRMLEDPAFANVQAVGGVTAIFGGAGGHGGAGRLPEHLGFEVLPHRPGGGRSGLFFERLYAWSLLAAYAPGSLEGRRLGDLGFVEVWMSRRAFLERFGDDANG